MVVANAVADAIQATHGTTWPRGSVCSTTCKGHLGFVLFEFGQKGLTCEIIDHFDSQIIHC